MWLAREAHSLMSTHDVWGVFGNSPVEHPDPHSLLEVGEPTFEKSSEDEHVLKLAHPGAACTTRTQRGENSDSQYLARKREERAQSISQQGPLGGSGSHYLQLVAVEKDPLGHCWQTTSEKVALAAFTKVPGEHVLQLPHMLAHSNLDCQAQPQKFTFHAKALRVRSPVAGSDPQPLLLLSEQPDQYRPVQHSAPDACVHVAASRTASRTEMFMLANKN